MLTPSQARAVLAELLEAAAGDPDARAAGASRLAALTPDDLVRLDDNARTGWSWAGSPWSSSLAADRKMRPVDGELVAALASLHPDGRVRQPAVQFLAGRPGALHASLLALRCVDHVVQVRDDAVPGLRLHTTLEEARAALPVLLIVARRVHGPTALSDYRDALLSRPDGARTLRGLFGDADRRTRRWAFSESLAGGLLDVADLLSAAQDRHDQLLRRAAADHLQEHRASAGPDALRALLTGRYAEGRVTALAALDDDDLTDDELRTALLDRSPRVRDTARWRGRRRGLDAGDLYRAALAEATDPRTVVASLTGLIWVGGRDDLPAIERRLDDPTPAVRVAAVQALVARAEPGQHAGRLGGMLLDPSPRVVAAAARALAGTDSATTVDAERDAWASTQPWSRGAAWRLGHTRGGWDRVEADLRAAGDPALSQLGRTSLLEWLRTSAATTWQSLGPPQAERLTALLDAAGLGEDVTQQVAFHAGRR